MLALAWQAISRCCQNCRITQLKRPLGPHPLHLLNAHIAAIFSLLLLSSKCAEGSFIYCVHFKLHQEGSLPPTTVSFTHENNTIYHIFTIIQL